jgi:hypothetical protein
LAERGGAILAAVRRAVLVVFLTLLTFQITGVAAALGDGPCDDDGDCPGDVSGGPCAPSGHCCSCCSLPTVVAAVKGVALVAPAARGTSWIGPDERLVSPDPDDILHVPKLLLA